MELFGRPKIKFHGSLAGRQSSGGRANNDNDDDVYWTLSRPSGRPPRGPFRAEAIQIDNLGGPSARHCHRIKWGASKAKHYRGRFHFRFRFRGLRFASGPGEKSLEVSIWLLTWCPLREQRREQSSWWWRRFVLKLNAPIWAGDKLAGDPKLAPPWPPAATISRLYRAPAASSTISTIGAPLGRRETMRDSDSGSPSSSSSNLSSSPSSAGWGPSWHFNELSRRRHLPLN